MPQLAMPIFLRGLHHYHPDQLVTNELLREISGADPSWIIEKTGIIERRSMWDYDGDFPGLEITKRCFDVWKSKNSGLLGEVGVIISASTHDDVHYPNTGNLIAEEESLEVPVFQIKTACTSVAYAIYLAKSLLRDDKQRDALILNGEAFTRYVDYGDKRSCILFGDAANVLLVSRVEGDFEVLDVEVGGSGLKIVQATRTSETSHLTVNEMASGELSPGKPWLNRRRKSDKKFSQDGRAVVDFVLSTMPEKVGALLRKNGLKSSDLSHIVLHQSNLQMMTELVKRLDIPETKHLFNVDRFGNTSSAGWISVLSQKKNEIRRGGLVLASVFGAGMTWSNILLRRV